MPHMQVEYSANLEPGLDMTAFCAAMRDVMMETGVFPLGGVRVRAYRSEAYVVADGAPENAFVALTLRMGAGRDMETKIGVREAVYAAAEAWLKPKVADRPFALSLELLESDAELSEKRFNTVHPAMKAKGL